MKKAESTEEMRRKGSFLRRFYGRKKISRLQDLNGEPTRYAKAAHAWGEPIPKYRADVKRLAKERARPLERNQKKKA